MIDKVPNEERRINPPCSVPRPVFFEGRRLYLPPRSRCVPEAELKRILLPCEAKWHEYARKNGFRIFSRIRSTNHLAVECLSCGALTAHRINNLQTAKAVCAGCYQSKYTEKANTANLIFLRRDNEDHKYAFYRAPCGHEIRRQFGFIDRIIAGETSLRCSTCLVVRESAEAQKQGWARVGRDPDGNANYRIYRHTCGYLQRVARANMSWGQVDCAACGKSWTAKPSSIYLVRITDPKENFDLLKLGYSKAVGKRFHHQLGLPDTATIEVLRIVKMPTGHTACAVEKKAHAKLRRRFPSAVVPASEYAGFIKVVSEIYHPWLRLEIEKLLDQIEVEAGLSQLP